MPVTTIGVFLLKKGTTGDSYSVVCPIKSYPAMGGDPEQIDVTTMSDSSYKYEPGLHANDAKTFTVGYDVTTHKALAALDGVETNYAIAFGMDATGKPTASDGAFTFSGKGHVHLNEGEVNAAAEETFTITPDTEPTFVDTLTIA